MNKVTKNVISYLLLAGITAFFMLFIFFLIYFARNSISEYLIVRSLKTAIMVRKALIKSLTFLPVVVIFIYVFSFSVLFTLKPFQTESFTYVNIVIPSYFLLILYIIFIVLSEFTIIPKLNKDIAVADYRLKIAHKALNHANTMLNENKNEEALSALNVLLEIDANNKEGLSLKEQASSKLPKPLNAGASTDKERTAADESSLNYFEAGKAEYERGNYYSALFYLERALRLHPDNAEIKEMYRRSKRMAENSFGQLTKDEKKKKEFIQKKTEAIEHLNHDEYYEAYEIFSYLNRSYPGQKDINLYLKEVTNVLKIKDFLPEEIKPLEWLPSLDDLVFIDKEGYIDTIERAIAFQNNFYFINIRRYNGMDRISHEKYGKWINGSIRLKSDEGFIKQSQQENDHHNIHPFISPNYLIYFGQRDTLAAMLNIYERITLSKSLLNSGLNIENSMLYLSKKIGIFSAIYIITLFLSAIAWSKRSVYTTPPKLKLFLFIIIVPFLVYFLYLFYLNVNNVIIYTHKYFSRYLIKNLNIAVYTGLINLAISLVATLFFLSQSKTE